MDVCSNPLQSIFFQLTCSNSKIGCVAEAIVLGTAQQIPVPSVQFAVHESWAETVRGFVIKVNRSLIRLKLTDSVLDV